MVSCDSVDSLGAFPPDVPGVSVDEGEGEASFPLHLDTCPLLQHAFPPELAADVVVEAFVPGEPECTAPGAYATVVGVDAHPLPSLRVPP